MKYILSGTIILVLFILYCAIIIGDDDRDE